MEFPQLFRTSRLSSLAKPLPYSYRDALRNNSSPYPHKQILSTPPASLHRRNWGLKAPIPAKHKSPYLVVDGLDTDEGITPYGAGSSFLRKQQRFREMGIPLNLGAGNDNYFAVTPSDSYKPALNTVSPQKLQSLFNKAPAKRKQFLRSLGKGHPVNSDKFLNPELWPSAGASAGTGAGAAATAGASTGAAYGTGVGSHRTSASSLGPARTFYRTEADLTRVAASYLGFDPAHVKTYSTVQTFAGSRGGMFESSGHGAGINKRQSRTAIGLNYGLKGALHNTPEGLISGKIVPGRAVIVRGTTLSGARQPPRACAVIGGFVVDTPIVTSGGDTSTKVKQVEKFHIRAAQANHNSIKIIANTVGNRLI